MNILVTSQGYPPAIGGVERQVELVARGLARRGHGVRVVTAAVAGAPKHEWMDGCEVHRVPAGGGNKWTRNLTYLTAMAAAVLRHGRDVDLIYGQQIYYPSFVVATLLPLLRKPFVVTNAGSGHWGGIRVMQRVPLGRVGMELIGRSAMCVSLSEEMTAEMKEAGIPRMTVIPNGVEVAPLPTEDERRAARARLGVTGPVLLSLSRLSPEKDVGLALRAFATYAPEGATFLVVGDGPEAAALRALAAAFGGAAERIRFVGPQSDVGPFLAAADVFVLSSESEGISYALLESMAAAVPPVATAVGGNRHVIGDGGDVGVLVPRNEADLGRALRDLLADGPRARAMGARARARVEERFSAAVMVDAYERLFEEELALYRRGHS